MSKPLGQKKIDICGRVQLNSLNHAKRIVAHYDDISIDTVTNDRVIELAVNLMIVNLKHNVR